MSARATAAMIRACHRRQWPAEYGRAWIPEPTSEELAFKFPRTVDLLPASPVYTTHCDRCDCDHGAAPAVLEYGEVAT